MGLEPSQRRKPRMANQTPPQLKKQILEMTARRPPHCYLHISGQRRLAGVGAAAAMVRGAGGATGLRGSFSVGFQISPLS